MSNMDQPYRKISHKQPTRYAPPGQSIGKKVDETGQPVPDVVHPMTQDHDWTNFDNAFGGQVEGGDGGARSLPARTAQQAGGFAPTHADPTSGALADPGGGGMMRKDGGLAPVVANPVLLPAFNFGASPANPAATGNPAQPADPLEPSKWAPMSTSTGTQQLMPSASGNRMVGVTLGGQDAVNAGMGGGYATMTPAQRGDALRARGSSLNTTSVGVPSAGNPLDTVQGMTNAINAPIDPTYAAANGMSVRNAAPGEAAPTSGAIFDNGKDVTAQFAPAHAGAAAPGQATSTTPDNAIGRGVDAQSQDFLSQSQNPANAPTANDLANNPANLADWTAKQPPAPSNILAPASVPISTNGPVSQSGHLAFNPATQVGNSVATSDLHPLAPQPNSGAGTLAVAAAKKPDEDELGPLAKN